MPVSPPRLKRGRIRAPLHRHRLLTSVYPPLPSAGAQPGRRVPWRHRESGESVLTARPVTARCIAPRSTPRLLNRIHHRLEQLACALVNAKATRRQPNLRTDSPAGGTYPNRPSRSGRDHPQRSDAGSSRSTTTALLRPDPAPPPDGSRARAWARQSRRAGGRSRCAPRPAAGPAPAFWTAATACQPSEASRVPSPD